MNLYTERHGMRTPVQHTETITVEMYSLIISCCEKYYVNLAHLFPEQCPDGAGCCGISSQDFCNMLKFEIPSLYRNSNNQIVSPQNRSWGDDEEFDQYALLDFIEYIGQNCRDISLGNFHGFFQHHHIDMLESDSIFKAYQNEINNIFAKTGLLFTLTENKTVERVVENGVLTAEIENSIKTVSELGIKGLLEEAVSLFKQRDPIARKNAVEKIWDAMERLKTYHLGLDKKASVEKVVSAMAGGQEEFTLLFNDEFVALTKIGNKFRIRHHETDKADIADTKHYDYFFNRCLSLIALAIQYLQPYGDVVKQEEEEDLPF